MIQRYLNLWFALSLDLFGGEISSNAASFFAAGLKGRSKEDNVRGPPRARASTYRMAVPKDGARGRRRTCPLRNAMNEVLRDEYVEDCQRGVDRWNKRLGGGGPRRAPAPARPSASTATSGSTPTCPSTPTASFARQGGVGPAPGRVAAHGRRPRLRRDPPEARCTEPGQIANWIAKPARGIKGLPFEYEYVRLED